MRFLLPLKLSMQITRVFISKQGASVSSNHRNLNTLLIVVALVWSGIATANSSNNKDSSRLPKMIERATQATLFISAKLSHGFHADRTAKKSWNGTAFLVDKERGWLLTNAHVAGYGPTELVGRFINDDSYAQLERVYVDDKHDIAVLKIDPSRIPTTANNLELDCSYTLERGEPVFAVGHPNGQRFTATMGILSGADDLNVKGNFLTTDLVIEQGNSGGPVMTAKNGLVVGISTQTINDSVIGQLTRSSDACKILRPMKEGKNPSRPYLGFQLMLINGQVSSVVANVLDQNHPIEVNDEILLVNGIEWNPTLDGDLEDNLRGTGSKVIFGVLRKGNPILVEAPLKENASAHRKDWVHFSGITLTESPFKDARERFPNRSDPVISVASLDMGELEAEEILFDERAEIISIDGIPIHGLARAYEILKSKKNRTVAVVARDVQISNSAYMEYFKHNIKVRNLKSSFD